MAGRARRGGWQLLELANLLSLARVPLGALVWIAPGSAPWVLALTAVAALTDLLDGWAARRGPHAGELAASGGEGVGAWLDPVCDKVFVGSVLAAVVVARSVAVELVLVVATRELVVLVLVAAMLASPPLRSRRAPLHARPLGKATTVAQVAFVGAALVGWGSALVPLAAAAGLLGLGAGIDYAVRALRPAHA